ncbi:TonB-dependent siderophore receptor [Erythrobacter sp. HL-111]|uniref:TonB-dependent receptor plug domain-containing protein n=1 Tax=Erythrobacter sp. HL-111 TaxID=1798193 RepID=UPI0006DAA446|nr:TonB-dependent receptor plug domain-containing protein [Erythrobacter sp. HL-111]KPP96262.1 MAG: TonB-dependent Receptor Plug Domain [Erythrobacteraceae bacterium HL-111]SDR75853.1 TonB-dependent Receptor Plug Domain [Erythrobacter sp. HL-111]
MSAFNTLPAPAIGRLPLFALVLVLGAVPAAAQDTKGESEPAEAVDPVAAGAETAAAADSPRTRRSFTPEDFARFAPRSALDMARQVPGFSIRQGGGARGLGAADTNVLVNGRRISGKSNGPVDALSRIPTDEVLRLELVDGASLDVGGLTGQVLNVVTRSSGGISGQFRYSPQFRSFGTPARLLDGSIAIAGGGDKDEWTLSLENNSNRLGDEGPELVFDGAGALIDRREEVRNENLDAFGLSGSWTHIAEGGNVLNLTGEVNGFIRRESEISQRSGAISPVDRTRVFETGEDEFNFELGADYQFALGPGRLKLIGYHRYEDSPTFAIQRTQFADGAPAEESVFTRDADEGETIARAEYAFGALGGDLLVAAEGVRNFLEITSALEQRAADGDLVPVPLPGANARVEEDRADLGLTYSRALAAGLQFQASGGAEYSQLRQSGALGLTRSFYRPKGFAALDWRALPRLNLSGRIERSVGQLSFFDFIATVDLDQDRENASNARLVPPQSWVFELEANLALGTLGSLNLRPFYEDISDIVDLVPLPGGGQGPGNLPSAELYGIDGDLTLLSDPIGWQGTRLDVGFSLLGSSLVDPLLGTPRELSGNDIVDLSADIRHDFAGGEWAVGGSANWEDNAPLVRLDEVALATQSFGFVSAFLENKDVRGLTLRANFANLIDRKNRFARTVFTDRAAGLVAFSETRERRFGTIFTFEVEGSF